ncbi:MAG: UDP-3-O-(3-hydroxymyristoyl)glucosamine N-acyltransferase, partial [Christensenella sp.]
ILAPEKPYGIVISCAPQADFYNLHNSLAHHAEYAGAKFDTVIGKNCTISPLACIAPQNVKIGDNVIIEEFVSIKEGTFVGDDCVIRSGSVLGAEGLEFSINNGNIIHVIHTGKAILGNRVEVQHNSVIGRAVLPHDNTTIGNDSKIDSIVMVGHNAAVGKRVIISSYSSVGGGCIIEDDVCIAACSCIKNRCIVHRNAHVTLGSVVVQNVNEGQTVTGNFATDHAEFLNNMLLLKRLHRK